MGKKEKKKQSGVKLGAGIVMILCAVWMGAVDTQAGSIWEEKEGIYLYTVQNGEATLTGITDRNREEIIVPTKLRNYPVTKIGNYAFNGSLGYSIKIIEIPEGITEIGERAFGNSDSLETVKLPKSLKSLARTVFERCDNLKQVMIHPENKNYQVIDNAIFKKQEQELLLIYRISNGLMVIPEGVKVLPANILEGHNVKKLILPKSLKTLESWKGEPNPSYDETDAEAVYYYEDEEYMKGYGIVYQTSYTLEAIEVHSENKYFKSIDGVLFTADETMLICYPKRKEGKNYQVPNKVKTIYKRAFAEGSYLESITLPKSVTKIGSYSFNRLYTLKKVTMQDTVTSIGKSAFSDTGLKKVTLSKRLKVIKARAFGHCVYLKSVTLPANLQKIERGAFEKCSSLVTMKIPDTVSSIGWYAFGDCKELKSIKLPKNLKEIAGYTFDSCSSLSSISIPSNVKKIGESAFESCDSLTSITIPKNVKTIEEKTFLGCSRLKKVTLPATLTKIEKFAFKKCSSLEKIKIPNNVRKIGKGAFHACKKLKTITLSKKLKELGDSAFLGCKRLKNITILSTVKKMGSNLFGENKKLQIKCKKNSAAHKYAKKNKLKYKLI